MELARLPGDIVAPERPFDSTALDFFTADTDFSLAMSDFRAQGRDFFALK